MTTTHRTRGRFAAIADPVFARLFFSLSISDVGVWAQNIVVAAHVLVLTGSPSLVGLATFGQLGPLLVGPLVGGRIADRFERRAVAAWGIGVQILGSLCLLAAAVERSPLAMVMCVMLVGSANAIGYPSIASIMTSVVPREALPSSVSLQNVQLNLARVFGPLLGGLLYSSVGAPSVYLFNTVTYLPVVAVLLSPLAVQQSSPLSTSTPARHLPVLRLMRSNAVVRYVFVRITLFSAFGLAFVGLMPVLAIEAAGIDVASAGYGLFYGTFAAGATFGAVAAGGSEDGSIVRRLRIALISMAAAVCALAFRFGQLPAYFIIAVLGACYMYALTTVLRELHRRITDDVRGRAVALWLVAYAGMASIGGLAFGPIVERTGVEAVLLTSGVAAVATAFVFSRAWLEAGLSPELRGSEPGRDEGAGPLPEAKEAHKSEADACR